MTISRLFTEYHILSPDNQPGSNAGISSCTSDLLGRAVLLSLVTLEYTYNTACTVSAMAQCDQPPVIAVDPTDACDDVRQVPYISHQSTAVFESAVSDVDAAADTGNSACAQWPPLAVPYVAPNRDVHVGESGWTSDDETLVKTVSSTMVLYRVEMACLS